MRIRFKQVIPQSLPPMGHPSCILPISVGQKYHEQKYLLCTLKKINKCFGKCCILLCDVLQRYTFSMNVEDRPPLALSAEAFEQAKILGEEWLFRNKEILQSLTIDWETLRWQTLLTHPKFDQHNTMVNALIASDLHLRKLVNNTAKSYIAKKIENRVLSQQYAEEYFLLEIQYLIEEMSVLSLLFEMQKFDYEVYAGTRNKPMLYLYEVLGKQYMHSSMTPLGVSFG